MAAKAGEKQLSVYCPVHRISFTAPRAGRILCREGRHALAQTFPHGEFWEYCCDCRNFYPYDAAASGGRRRQCLSCDRQVAKRYLCSHCKVMSLESDAPDGAREFSIAPGDAPQPSCPACLELETRPLRTHECGDLGASFATARGLCPFCDTRIEGEASLPATALALILDEVRELKSRQQALSLRLDEAVGALGQRIEEGFKKIERGFTIQFARQRHELDALARKLEAQRPGDSPSRRPSPGQSAAPPPAPPPAPPTAYQALVVGAAKPAAFPVSAAEYLNLVRRIAVSVKSDALNEMLVRDLFGGGEMMIVEDPSAARELLYSVPTLVSFKTKQDFYVYYDKYFDCYRPIAGDVWIIRPAVVSRAEGGWKLVEKGELEVR